MDKAMLVPPATMPVVSAASPVIEAAVAAVAVSA
jgi:hypothetical protein